MRGSIPCSCGQMEMSEIEWKHTLFCLDPRNGTVHYVFKCGVLFHNDDDPCDPTEMIQSISVVLHKDA